MRVRMTGAALVIAAMGVMAGAAQAPTQPQTGGGRVKQACASDVQTLCPGVQPGGGRIRQCLRDNAARLSDGCKEASKTARAARGKTPAS